MYENKNEKVNRGKDRYGTLNNSRYQCIECEKYFESNDKDPVCPACKSKNLKEVER